MLNADTAFFCSETSGFERYGSMTYPIGHEQFLSYEETIPKLFDAIQAYDVLAKQRQILIKPNLVNASPPPVTLPVSAAESMIKYCRKATKAPILIAEGIGDPNLSTWEVFTRHGYDRLTKFDNVKLVDLNEAELTKLSRPQMKIFPDFWMPKIVMDSFLISAAVLKVHSLAQVTLSMKNLVGIAPPRFYQHGGYWRKSAFHKDMHRSVFELNCYRCPDLAFIDGRVGLAESHLGGPECHPPIEKLIAGFDSVAVDAFGARCLKREWRDIGHIALADGVLGFADAVMEDPPVPR